jgi:hypothetical protein
MQLTVVLQLIVYVAIERQQAKDNQKSSLEEQQLCSMLQ